MRVPSACITKQHGTQHRSRAVLHNSGRMSFFKTLRIQTWMMKGFLIFAIKKMKNSPLLFRGVHHFEKKKSCATFLNNQGRPTLNMVVKKMLRWKPRLMPKLFQLKTWHGVTVLPCNPCIAFDSPKHQPP